jgi:hypothetical protein
MVWGRQKTTVIGERAGGGVDGGLQKVGSDQLLSWTMLSPEFCDLDVASPIICPGNILHIMLKRLIHNTSPTNHTIIENPVTMPTFGTYLLARAYSSITVPNTLCCYFLDG